MAERALPFERARVLAQLVLLAAAYYAAGRFSLSLAIAPGYATAVWPPSGIALAALLLGGTRLWPGVWAGAALVNYGVQGSLAAAVAIGTGDTLEALAAAALVRRAIGAAYPFERAADVVKFIVIAMLAAAIAASVALVPLGLGYALAREELLSNWWTWWEGDASGIVIVTPLVLAWLRRGEGALAAPKRLEALAIAALLFAVALPVFGNPDPLGHPFARSFLIIPLVIWAAFRLGQREVVTLGAATSAIAVWNTVEGRGPFVAESLNRSLLALLLFVGIVVATGLMLSAVLGERRRATQELRRQRDELERRVEERTADLAAAMLEADSANRAKSEFLARMSHELRTPLNSLLILAKLLADNPEGNLGAKQLKYAQTIHDAGMDLLAIINDILDLSRIESGKLPPLNFSRVPFAELQDYVERTFRQVAQEKGLEFAVELAPGLPAGIETDAQRLQQVLRNLLANAFKFTPRGGVRLRIAREDGRAAFAVSDTGIGIAQDQIEAVFEAFQQADGGTRRQFGGAGLGLSISRELGRLLGGEIRVASRPGEGSTFTLVLPLERG